MLFSRLFNETQKLHQSVFNYTVAITDLMDSVEVNDPRLRLQIYIKGLKPELRTEFFFVFRNFYWIINTIHMHISYMKRNIRY